MQSKYKETYCLEVLNNIVKNVHATELLLVSAHYNLTGVVAVVEDQYNKQKYEIKISPMREEERV